MKTEETKNELGKEHDVLISHNNSPTAKETPEEWWAKISPLQKTLAQQIAAMMDEVTESKRVEIRKECEAIRARFIHILKQPEKGCLSAIILPESCQ
jgi:hypothetical protein